MPELSLEEALSFKERMNENIECLSILEGYLREEEMVKEAEQRIPSEEFIKDYSARLEETMPRIAREILTLYNCLCSFTRDTEFTKKRQPISLHNF